MTRAGIRSRTPPCTLCVNWHCTRCGLVKYGISRYDFTMLKCDACSSMEGVVHKVKHLHHALTQDHLDDSEAFEAKGAPSWCAIPADNPG